MFKLLKSSSKMLEDSPEGVVFVYSEDASFAKSAVEVLKEQASKKGKKSKSYPFSKFNDIKFNKKMTLIIVVDQHTKKKEIDEIVDFLDKQSSGYLANVKLALFAFVTTKDLDHSKVLRSKIIELGADELYSHHGIPTGEKSLLRSLSDELWSESSNSESKGMKTRALSWGNKPTTQTSSADSNEWLNYPSFITKFRNGVAISEQIWGEKSLQNCFTGVDAVDWICQNAKEGEVINRSQALGIGQMMLQDGVFSHVTNEQPFRDKTLIYKFNDEDSKRNNTWTPPPEWA